MVICDHINVNRVNPVAFQILRRRFGDTGADRLIAKKLDRYIPWVDREPTLEDIREHLRLFLKSSDSGLAIVLADLEMKPTEPDADFLRAYAVCYHWLAVMADVRLPEQLLALADCPADAPDLPPAEKWVLKLWKRRTQFMQFAAAWIRHVLQDQLKAAGKNPDEIRRRLSELAERHERGGWGGSLFEPETAIAKRLVEHWQRILDPPLPARDDEYGGHKLTRPLQRGSSVWLTTDPCVLAAVRVESSVAAKEGLMRTWESVQAVARKFPRRFPEIIALPSEATNAVMLMKKVQGKNLEDSWSAIKDWPLPDRVLLARQLLLNISDALSHLHAAGLAHGDLRPANVMHDDAERFVLVDFGRTTDGRTPPAGGRSNRAGSSILHTLRFRPALTNSGEAIDWLKERDAIALFEMCFLMIAKVDYAYGFGGSLDRLSIPAHFRPWTDKLNARWILAGR